MSAEHRLGKKIVIWFWHASESVFCILGALRSDFRATQANTVAFGAYANFRVCLKTPPCCFYQICVFGFFFVAIFSLRLLFRHKKKTVERIRCQPASAATQQAGLFKRYNLKSENASNATTTNCTHTICYKFSLSNLAVMHDYGARLIVNFLLPTATPDRNPFYRSYTHTVCAQFLYIYI